MAIGDSPFCAAKVRFSYGLGVERFERFRFSVQEIPLGRVFLSLCFGVLCFGVV